MHKKLKSNIKSAAKYSLFVIFGLLVGTSVKMVFEFITAPPEVVSIKKSAHFADTAEPVVIYVTEWCPYCKQLKRFLDEKNISYQERDIEKVDEDTLALYESLGIEGVPATLIGDIAVNGLNIPRITQELEKQKLL